MARANKFAHATRDARRVVTHADVVSFARNDCMEIGATIGAQCPLPHGRGSEWCRIMHVDLVHNAA